jgi:hypothetical protein
VTDLLVEDVQRHAQLFAPFPVGFAIGVFFFSPGVKGLSAPGGRGFREPSIKVLARSFRSEVAGFLLIAVLA